MTRILAINLFVRDMPRLSVDLDLVFPGHSLPREQALALRFPELDKAGIQPSRLLECRRVDDTKDDLWTVLNRVQENLLGGGLIRRTETGRLSRTRRITSIREDVRLNGRLWDLAEEVLAA